MTSQFAKLFEFKDIGQVLVTMESGDESPELRVQFQPKGLGVCTIKSSFEGDDEDAQWDAVEKAFGMMDANRAYSMVKPNIEKFSGMFSGQVDG